MRRVQKLDVFSIGLLVKIWEQWQESKMTPSCYGFTHLKWWTMLADIGKSHPSFQNFLTIRIIYISICVCSVLSRIQLWQPMHCSLPGSSVHGISQARTLEWVAISYSRESSWPRDRTPISYVCCIGRQILYPCTTKESPVYKYWCLLFDLK